MNNRKKIKRKCFICKEDIDLNAERDNFFVEISEKNHKTKRTFKHKECFIRYETGKKRYKKSLEECELHIKRCESNFQDFEKNELEKENLFNFIFENYDITFLSARFYIKIASIFDGSMQNINKPIPPCDLLDMWQRKKNWLDRVSENNRKKGKEIIGEQRVLYDLSILLSKYDSYLEWREQQKLAQIEKEKSYSNKINYDFILNTPKNNNKSEKKEEIDIMSLLDGI